MEIPVYIYVSAVDSGDWGSDKLGDDVLSVADRFPVVLPRDGRCQYDVRVVYGDGATEERRNQDVCAISEMAFSGADAQPPPDPVTATPTTSFGTGFFVSAQGYALTNNHVTEDCRSIDAHLDGRRVTAQLVRQDETNDLALLRVQAPGPVAFARFRAGSSIRAGEGILVAGFPLPSLLQNGLNITVGNVSALAGLGGNTALMQITAPVQPGNSGGSLLDLGGNLVGVVVSKLDAVQALAITGDIPQNINFAIKGAVARLFLEAAGVTFEERRTDAELPTGDVGDQAREFTFQVECTL